MKNELPLIVADTGFGMMFSNRSFASADAGRGLSHEDINASASKYKVTLNENRRWNLLWYIFNFLEGANVGNFWETELGKRHRLKLKTYNLQL
jgi:hypothetical protein